jgi:CRP-like cAMP-binding protein
MCLSCVECSNRLTDPNCLPWGLPRIFRRKTGALSAHMGNFISRITVSAMCSVIVIEQSQYWTITRSDLEEFINNYPQAGVQLVISLASLLSKRLRSVTRRLIEEVELAVVRASLLVDP